MAGWNPAQALPVITCATCTRNRRSMLKDYADCTPLNAANDEPGCTCGCRSVVVQASAEESSRRAVGAT